MTLHIDGKEVSRELLAECLESADVLDHLIEAFASGAASFHRFCISNELNVLYDAMARRVRFERQAAEGAAFAMVRDITELGGGPEDGGEHPPGCDCDYCGY